MAAIDWNSLSSAADWEGALSTLTQDAATAKTGTIADRQVVEGELTNFWVIPCPFTKKIDRARQLYNELVLTDLSKLIGAPTVAVAQTASGPAPVAAAPGPPCAALSGYVMGNEKPLAGATVAIPGTRLLAITNSEGYYTLPTANVPKPTLLFSAAGYEPQSITPTSCADEHVEMQLLPGTRIKKRGKRKGFILKNPPSAQ